MFSSGQVLSVLPRTSRQVQVLQNLTTAYEVISLTCHCNDPTLPKQNALCSPRMCSSPSNNHLILLVCKIKLYSLCYWFSSDNFIILPRDFECVLKKYHSNTSSIVHCYKTMVLQEISTQRKTYDNFHASDPSLRLMKVQKTNKCY